MSRKILTPGNVEKYDGSTNFFEWIQIYAMVMYIEAWHRFKTPLSGFNSLSRGRPVNSAICR